MLSTSEVDASAPRRLLSKDMHRKSASHTTMIGGATHANALHANATYLLSLPLLVLS
jgi:hypothetical protein